MKPSTLWGLKKAQTKLVALALAAFAVMALAFSHGANAAMVDGSYHPNDAMTIKKVSDGTHAGEGTETFINEKNGYKVGDNTPDDGVVASGDTVAYKWVLSVEAGRARTLEVRFDDMGGGGALRLEDFGRMAVSGSAVSGEFDASEKVWRLKVSRGATATVEGTVYVRAADTAGKVVKNNKVRATLTDGAYSAVSIADPVTVVSAPLADLTIDSVRSRRESRNYTADAPTTEQLTGSFNIEPAALKWAGHSNHGATAASAWKTDVDVSKFPAGTLWRLDGKSVPVSGGKLKNLTGTGDAKLEYTLPTSVYPTQDGTYTKTWRIQILPHADSFAAGDLRNVTDPGSGQNASYDTSKAAAGGRDLGAVRGVTCANNNFAEAVWRFERGTGIVSYYVHAARDASKTVFEDANLKLNPGSAWYAGPNIRNMWFEEGVSGQVAPGTEMFAKVTVDVSKAVRQGNAAAVAPSKVVLGDTWNWRDASASDKWESASYDRSRRVVVTVGGKVLDGSKHTVTWRRVPKTEAAANTLGPVSGATAWREADAAPDGSVNQVSVSFAANAWTAGANTGLVEVYIPVKVAADADSGDDGTHMVQSTGVASDSAGAGFWNVGERTEAVQEPRAPKLRADVEVTSTKASISESGVSRGTSVVELSVRDTVSSATRTSGHKGEVTLELSEHLDPATFKVAGEANGWSVASVDGRTVTLRNDALALEQNEDRAGDPWRAASFDASVETVLNLSEDGGEARAVVKESSKLHYKGVGSVADGTASSTDAATASVAAQNAVSALIEAVERRVEVGDAVSFVATYNAGRLADDGSWSQTIVLPRNGDVDRMAQVAASNGQDIDIDPETGLDRNEVYDSVGRTRHHGESTLASARLEEGRNAKVYWSDSEVDLTDPASGNWRELPVGKDGAVDVSGLSSYPVALKVAGTGNLGELQAAGGRLFFEVGTKGSAKGDDYVAWLSRMETPAVAETRVPWPVDATVVASEVAGTVWSDNDEDGRIGEEERRLSGVTVELEARDGDSWKATGRTTKTDGNGDWSFDNLHSGDYRARLSQVERADGSADVAAVGGKTGPEAADGDLVQAVKNRFDASVTTRQTYSYGGAYGARSTVAPEVKVPKETRVDRVDFGFNVSSLDLSLDKTPASVTMNSDGTATVAWDVLVASRGLSPVDGLELTDRTSSRVADLTAKVSYDAYEPGLGLDRGWGATQKGSSFRNMDDIPFWYSRGDDASELYGLSFKTEDHDPADAVLQKAEGVTGRILAATGTVSVRNDQDVPAGTLPRAKLVSTTDGVWRAGLKADGGYTLQKLQKFPEDIVGIASRGVDSNAGALLWGKTRAWVVSKNNQVTELKGLAGTIGGAAGWTPNGTNNGDGAIIYTDQGCWFLHRNNSLQKLAVSGKVRDVGLSWQGHGAIVTDTAVHMTQSWGNDNVRLLNVKLNGLVPSRVLGMNAGEMALCGLGLWGPDGYYITGGHQNAGSPSLSFTKVSGIDEPLTGGHGRNPHNYWGNKDYIGSVVWNAKKLWFVDGAPSYKATQVTGFEGDVIEGVLQAAPGGPRALIRTDRGLFVASAKTGWKASPMGGFEGRLLAMYHAPELYDGGHAFPKRTRIVYVAEGGLFTDLPDPSQPSGRRVVPVAGTAGSWDSVDSQVILPASDALVGEWRERSFELPRLEAGKTIRVRLEGQVYVNEHEIVVGNQAWVTSPETPRAGIEAATAGEVKTTGKGMAAGVPDLPALPAFKDVEATGIKGTPTVALNLSGINGADSTRVDDLADQTPAKIALPSGTPPAKGAIAGTAWYDVNRDGVRDAGEPRAAGVRVRVNLEDGPLVADTVTDRDGRWKVEGLASGKRHEVAYEISGHRHDGKDWTATKVNMSGTDTADDSDADWSGFVVRTVAAADPATDGRADVGLVPVEGSIRVIKGAHDAAADGSDADDYAFVGDAKLEAELAPVADVAPMGPVTGGDAEIDDGDGDGRTRAWGFEVRNTGANALADVRISDRTDKGQGAKVSTKLAYYPDGRTPDVSAEYLLVDGLATKRVTAADGKVTDEALRMAPGSALFGAVSIAFTEGEPAHADTIEATARVSAAPGHYAAEVRDSDSLAASYEVREAPGIVIEKVSGGDGRTLAGATFLLERTSHAATPDADEPGAVVAEVGRFVTGEDGRIEIRSLEAGVYRLTEVEAPAGYLTPRDGAWYVELKWGEGGAPETKVSAKGDLPYIEVVGGEGDWGLVRVQNQPIFKVPFTGAGAAGALGLVAAATSTAGIAWTTRRMLRRL